MDSQKFIDTFTKNIDSNFNFENQFVNYFEDELNKANLNINQEQAQHLFNILEFVSKSPAKIAAVSLINTLIELEVLTKK